MDILDVILIGIALSMDAFAVGMTNGMVEPKMKWKKVLLIALFYGGFQAVMPLTGYFVSGVFSSFVAKIAPWLAFVLLAFLGGKMIFDCFHEEEQRGTPLSVKQLFIQSVATSIDALAVGVSMLALDAAGELRVNVFLAVGLIGCITFCLSVLAVQLGKVLGNKLASKAELVGGLILIGIGLKILLGGIL